MPIAGQLGKIRKGLKNLNEKVSSWEDYYRCSVATHTYCKTAIATTVAILPLHKIVQAISNVSTQAAQMRGSQSIAKLILNGTSLRLIQTETLSFVNIAENDTLRIWMRNGKTITEGYSNDLD